VTFSNSSVVSAAESALVHIGRGRSSWRSPLSPGAMFYNFFICDLQMGQISESACTWQAFQALSSASW